MDPVNLTIELLSAAVFVGALVSLVRGHDPLAGDVLLVFSALAIILVLQIVQLFTPLPPAVAVAALLLLLAQPVFTLRLVGHVRPLPRLALPVAAVAFLASALPVAILTVVDRQSALVRPLTALVAIDFVVTELVAAVYLGLEARQRAGSARVRLIVATIATASFAIALLAAGAASVTAPPAGQATANAEPTVAAIASRATLLLSAVGYVVAFLPPAWLRRIWQATAAYDYGQQILAAPATEDESAIWGRLVHAAAEIGGGTAAIVLVARPDGSTRIAASAGPAVAGLGETAPASLDELTGLAGNRLQRIVAGRSALLDDLAVRTDAQYATIVPLPPTAGRRGALLHLSGRASLFGSDDAALLATLGNAAAIMVERRVVLAEQEQLSERLKATVSALESASQAKSDFLASMSHELRTPLNAVIGFSDLMRGEPRDGDAVHVPAEWVEHIHGSGQHLLGLINDVLDLAKVEAGRMDLVLDRLDLQTALLESVAGLRPLADRKSIAIETDIEPLVIEADRGRFRQIVYNLLSNAIKYTPDGGTIRLEVAARGEEVAVTVADTGVGISAADQPFVFDEFRQVGDPSERQPGTGLGLALTKRLVEAHHGRIELTSEPRAGSRFTVVFPAARAESAQAIDASTGAVPDGRPAGSPGSDILVIEDDPSAARLLRAYLEADGYLVRIAGDGELGIADAHRSRPDAIVLDIILPGLDGWDVLRQLKTDVQLRDVPVIIVTVVDEREVGLALGAADYLVKPVERGALLACLARITHAGADLRAAIRVLAVDDDPATLDMIDASLRPDGFDVIRASGGRIALDLARSRSPDLVICDLLMPDLDGFGVVAELSADPATRHLPILILTAHELSAADKTRLNGKILGVVAKGENGKVGLHEWLSRTLSPAGAAGAGADGGS